MARDYEGISVVIAGAHQGVIALGTVDIFILLSINNLPFVVVVIEVVPNEFTILLCVTKFKEQRILLSINCFCQAATILLQLFIEIVASESYACIPFSNDDFGVAIKAAIDVQSICPRSQVDGRINDITS